MSAQDAIRIVTSQSGRSFRVWKVGSWLTLAMINMSIAESKGRGKFRWGFTSLAFGPLVTAFLSFSKPIKEDPNTLIPRSAAQDYNSEEQSGSMTRVGKVTQSTTANSTPAANEDTKVIKQTLNPPALKKDNQATKQEA